MDCFFFGDLAFGLGPVVEGVALLLEVMTIFTVGLRDDGGVSIVFCGVLISMSSISLWV